MSSIPRLAFLTAKNHQAVQQDHDDQGKEKGDPPDIDPEKLVDRYPLSAGQRWKESDGT